MQFIWQHEPEVRSALNDPTLSQRLAARVVSLFEGSPSISAIAALRQAWDLEAGKALGVAYARERHIYPIWWTAGVMCGLDRADASSEAWADRVDRERMSAALRKIAETGQVTEAIHD